MKKLIPVRLRRVFGQEEAEPLTWTDEPLAPPPDVLAKSAALQEREKIVAFLRREARDASRVRGVESPTDKFYRTGEKDAYLLAADAIARGLHL